MNKMCSSSSSVQLYLIVGVFAFLAHSANGISCYSCESDNNENCGQSFYSDNVPVIDCEEQLVPRYLQSYNNNLKPTGCKKVVLERFDGQEIIQRFCYFGSLNNTNEGCRQEPSFQGKTIKCEVCNQDLCNSSSIIRSNLLIISIISSIFGLLFYII